MRTFLLCLVVISSLLSCNRDMDPIQGGKPAEQKTISLTVDGNTRSFIRYLPSGYDQAGRMPIILAIHGGSGTPEGMMKVADFKPIAEREKAVLVYPAGIQKNWNDGRPTTPNQLGIDDVNFFNQLCDHLIANYPVDANRIYATGISNGGFMSARLGCQLSNRIAAIAIVAATMEATVIAPGCTPGRPVPAMFIHGTLDPLVPFNGGEMTAGGTAGGTILSHFGAVEKWISINGCSSLPSFTDLPDIAMDGTTIRKRVYTGGINGSEVVSYVITNGGHTWPQGYQYLNELFIGKTTQDMNGCEVIWAFFKRFNRT